MLLASTTKAKKTFESGLATRALDADRILNLIDDDAYLKRLSLSRPPSLKGLLDAMVEDHVIVRRKSGLYAITNLGAVCFARDLTPFEKLASKAFRIVKYVGRDRSRLEKHCLWEKGYAADYDGMMRLLHAFLPAREFIGPALRCEVSSYSPRLVCKLILDAFVRQDFRLIDAGPMLEIFDDRLEISYPIRSLEIAPQNVELTTLIQRMAFQAAESEEFHSDNSSSSDSAMLESVLDKESKIMRTIIRANEH